MYVGVQFSLHITVKVFLLLFSKESFLVFTLSLKNLQRVALRFFSVILTNPLSSLLLLWNSTLFLSS